MDNQAKVVKNTAETYSVLPADISAKIMGRSFYDGDRLYLTYSGSEIGFFFDGEHLEAQVYSDKMSIMPTLKASIGVFVGEDEEMFKRYELDPGNAKVLVFDREEYASFKGISKDALPQKLAIHFVKVSEAAFGSFGIDAFYCDKEDTFEALPENELKIEYIGDSITCGYGVEGVLNVDEFTTSQENPYKSFSIRSAKSLHADYQLCSWSGIGVISKYIPPEVDEPDTSIMIQEIYPYTAKELQERMKMEPVLWDFDRFVPNVIVLNIGTNDSSYTREKADREAYYAKTMKQFIHMIHEKNPQAKIVFVYGVMDQTLCATIDQMVKELVADGNDYISYLHLPFQDEADGIGTDSHPSALTQEKCGRMVVEFIKNNVL